MSQKQYNYDYSDRDRREDLLSAISNYLILNEYYTSRNRALTITLRKLELERSNDELYTYITLLKKEFLDSYKYNTINIVINEN